MSVIAADKVEVYVFCRRRTGVEFLALRRAAGRSLPGIWQPVTGKIELLETFAEAARREVREETGLEPRHWWRLEMTTLCLDAKGRTLMALPLLAAEVGARESVTLSREHDEARFVPAREAAKLFLWDSQRQGLAAVERQILPGGPLADALALEMPRPITLARALARRPKGKRPRKKR